MYTRPGRGRAARPRVPTSRLASAATSAASLRRDAGPQRRRRNAEVGELGDQALDPFGVGLGVDAVDRRHPLRSSSCATCSLARIISRSISRWDSVCGTGAGAERPRPSRRSRTRARPTRPRGWSDRGARPAPPPCGGRSRSARRPLRGARAAGEDLVELVVVEADVGADPAAVEARLPHRAAGAQLDLDGDREPLDPGRQAAGAGAEHERQHRLDARPARRCCSRAAAPRGRAASRAGRGRRRRRCGSRAGSPSPSRWAETASSKSRALAGSTVKVVSSVRSRRGGERSSADLGRAPRLVLERRQRSRAVARAPRGAAPRPPRGPFLGAAAAPARAAPAHPCSCFLFAEHPEGAVERLVARGARVRRAALTSGWMPLPARLVAVGGEVLADRQLQRAAVGEVDLLLEDALAEGAGADDLGAGVVGQRRGEDLRGGGGVAVDQDDDRALGQVVAHGAVLGVPLGAGVGRDDDFVLGQEDARREHRLLEQAAAVGAQVEDEPLGAFALDLLDGFAQVGVGAVAEGREPDVAELAAAYLAHFADGDRHRDLGPGDRQLPRSRRSRVEHADRHLGPFRALDPVRRDFAVDAWHRLAVDRDDRRPRSRSRRGRRASA